VELIARHHTQSDKSPYERLLGDAVRGDTSLFTHDDTVEAAWRVVDPVLHDPLPVAFYEPGTWGPPEADRVIEGDETWHNPTAETSAPC
jgi:glucose-6-phosphate 1-dehydrogenase